MNRNENIHQCTNCGNNTPETNGSHDEISDNYWCDSCIVDPRSADADYDALKDDYGPHWADAVWGA